MFVLFFFLSFGHCAVCPSIDVFWLCCLSFDWRILITRGFFKLFLKVLRGIHTMSGLSILIYQISLLQSLYVWSHFTFQFWQSKRPYQLLHHKVNIIPTWYVVCKIIPDINLYNILWALDFKISRFILLHSNQIITTTISCVFYMYIL